VSVTFRAIILGLLSAVFVATVGYVTSFMRVPALTRGHLPISIFGLLFVLMAAINPLLHRVRAAWRLRSTEIAVALAMVLVSCNIPHAGLMRTFSSILVLPIHFNKALPGWRKVGVLNYVPPGLLVTPGGDESQVVGGFISGLGKPGQPIGLGDVPWAAWEAPLSFWIPIVVLAAVATISLSLIVHRQWAHRERLRYPIADFANTLIDQEPHRFIGPIFRNKLFWLGLILLLSIRVFNCANSWAETGVDIPLKFKFEAIRLKFPKFAEMEEARYVVEPLIIPTAMAFTFFLASDIGFSMGITSLVTLAAQYVMVRQLGMTVTAANTGGGIKSWVSFGAFFGYTLVLLYIGRRAYWQTFKRAVLFRAHTDTDAAGAWAGRLFLLSCAGMVAMLTAVGMGLGMAVLLIALVVITFLVLARINAECGAFFFKPEWTIVPILGGLFSMPVLGPKATVLAGMLMIVLLADPFESLIPYVINGLKIADVTGVSPGKTASVQAVAFVVALAVAMPIGLWADYNYGRVVDASASEGSSQPAGSQWSKVAFSATERGLTATILGNQLQQTLRWSSWDRLLHMRPVPMFLPSVAVGLIGVLLLSGLRLRYPWWPLHPIILLGFGAWTMGKFGASFLLGWIIKSAITRLGGPKAYHQGRHFMMGVIAGDLCGGMIYMATYYIHYAVTGTQISGPMLVLW
jgi:hypothetical protein